MVKSSDHKSKLNALRRIEGQVRGVQGMIENHKTTLDILTQTRAIKGALSKVEVDILREHLQDCVVEIVQKTSKKGKQQALDEILKVISQTRKG